MGRWQGSQECKQGSEQNDGPLTKMIRKGSRDTNGARCSEMEVGPCGVEEFWASRY